MLRVAWQLLDADYATSQRLSNVAICKSLRAIKYQLSCNSHQMLYMHNVLSVMQVCKPKDFAMQINLHMENCWGIVRAVIDLCLKLDEGKYIIVKEPNKPVMRLYSVPENAFEQVSFAHIGTCAVT